MPEKDFEIPCKKCGQTFIFTVKREGEGVTDITRRDALLALGSPGRTDPNTGAIIVGHNAVKNICPQNTPFEHAFDYQSLTSRT
ncbi:hypothetical protein A2702_00340 [Candidatus Amesbacteria bacterium RIFCSPHIGHO2_01_FULL_48_75]|nr:MAG: hypothetical protein A2702_00340 [Candidatus Amesbacteria bacterium RIFCSPHIGHO2_01_FULL_48_75]OGD02684.1 MAG: hypothetical protein A2354_01560 [Candidatus Amesbacteria bacterium RIFOXYB1_FULL_47_12]